MNWSALDWDALELVLQLACQGGARVAPNPLVGAVLVREDEVVGQAFHRAAGEPHAEVLALQQAGDRARGSTLYINLEPCCHQGRTPPCVPELLAAGVERVVVGLRDPDPRVRGGGVEALRQAGVVVQSGPGEWVQRCLELNRSFVHSVLFQRPFVTLKYAMTLDGFVATQAGEARWITGAPARQRVHEERALHAAMLVGSGTVLRDDPHLNVRGLAGAQQPIRVVADRRGRTSPEARLFNSPGGPIWLAHGALAEESWKASVRQAGGELFSAEHPEELLAHLHSQGLRSLFLEGGPTLAGAFLEAGLVQRVLVFVAPVLIGGQGRPALEGRGVSLMKDAVRLQRCSWSVLGDDWMLDGELDSAWREWEANC